MQMSVSRRLNGIPGENMLSHNMSRCYHGCIVVVGSKENNTLNVFELKLII